MNFFIFNLTYKLIIINGIILKKENIINKRIKKISMNKKKEISNKISKFIFIISILNLSIFLFSFFLFNKEIKNQECYQSYMSGEIYKCDVRQNERR